VLFAAVAAFVLWPRGETFVPPPIAIPTAPPPPTPEPGPHPPPPEPEPEQPKAVPSKMGWAELSSTPAVNVFVKGKSMGRTPLKLALPPGKHAVRLAEAGIEKTLQLVIRAGAT